MSWRGCASRLPIGASHIRFAFRDGHTALVAAHTEVPLLVQRPRRGPSGEAVVTLLTPAGALFDSDVVHLDVECGPCANVTLVTTSATKLNRCDAGTISFNMTVRAASGSTVRYLPHELIPFTGCRYHQRIDVELESDARVLLMEVITPGSSHAPFTYTQLDFTTNIFRERKLQVRERFTMTPRSSRQLGGHSHYGSLLVVPDQLQMTRCSSLSELPGGGSVVKLLGGSAQSVRSALLGAACSRP